MSAVAAPASSLGRVSRPWCRGPDPRQGHAVLRRRLGVQGDRGSRKSQDHYSLPQETATQRASPESSTEQQSPMCAWWESLKASKEPPERITGRKAHPEWKASELTGIGSFRGRLSLAGGRQSEAKCTEVLPKKLKGWEDPKNPTLSKGVNCTPEQCPSMYKNTKQSQHSVFDI